MLIASSAAIRSAEEALFATGACSSAELMDAVVARLRTELEARLGGWQPERVIAYLGRGNNAGDAVGLAARCLAPSILRCAAPVEKLSADTQRQLSRICEEEYADSAPPAAPDTLIIDGLLGSGASGPLRPEIAELVREMNALRDASPRSITVAVDIPTGLLSGGADAVRADISCPIGCVKPAMLEDGAEENVGQLLPIPLPEVEIAPATPDRVMEEVLMQAWLPRRAYSCYKNRAGRVAIVAGSIGMLGAAQLAAEAALAAGAGLVVLYCLPECYDLLATRVAAEIMVRPVESYAHIEEPEAQALLIGPGLGRLPQAERAALHALAQSFHGPVVLDADILNTAAAEQWDFAGHTNWILTPHPGEMRRLAPQHADLPRREQVVRFINTHSFEGALVLKGARSITAQGKKLIINGTGGPFMANGGQGDVLAGTIAALAAQGLPALHAAALAAHACGRAATLAWARNQFARAITATQTLSHLPYVLS